MSDPYPIHPDQVEYDHESLFHSNGSDYGKPEPVSGQRDDYVQNEDIVQIAHSALQNELFAEENDVENDVQNEDFVAHEVPFENSNNNTMNRMEENNLLWPVLPGESGEGLPYAPIDWPYPGDIWTWRVGRRFNSSGYFQDRFLYLPKRLGKQMFASKNAVLNYIKSNIPGADLDAFFASFAWKIPAKFESPMKESATLPPPPPPSPPPQEEKVAGAVEEEKVENFHPSGRKKRSTTVIAPKQPEQDVEPSSPMPKRRRQSGKQKESKLSPSPKPKQTKQSGGKSSSASRKAKQNEAALSSSPKPKRDTRQPSRRSSRTVINNEVEEEPVMEPIPEDFDNYLSSLEDILTQPLTLAKVATSSTPDSAAIQIEMAEARSKLSSLLVMDFPSLILPKHITELTTLASKLRKDPTMNAEQLVKLKLIEEIPSFSEVYMESRELIAQVDEFFATLEGRKAKVASLRNEYSELKEKADQLQAQVDANSMAVDEIDRQIAMLRTRRAELTDAIDTNKAAKSEVAHAQKMVANAIPKVVHEIQLANSRMPELELKKINAVKRESEIRAKFASLEGFSL